ncbi:MAG: type II toxin-antitoxin system Phd/YefM family antitoxin [Candidatus Omnitrophica bacterium]|nr:type II toxin-antitoxin system Phd/YefM family antitoxin [Candidatus Omnitrophota bacterium]
MTQTITLKELRPELPKVVDAIDAKMDRYVVTRHGKPVIVMLSIEDYEALMETLDILADPEARKGIKQGVKDAGQGRTRSWQEIKRSLEKI